MVAISRSTKPRPRHQPLVDALEERLALTVGTAQLLPIGLHPPAAIGGTNSGTATPAVAVEVSIEGHTDYTYSGPVGVPAKVPFTYSGHGIARQIGTTTTDAWVTPTFNANGALTGYKARAIVTAANGDKIILDNGTATFEGDTTTSPPPSPSTPFIAHGEIYVTGGTGRFENATGMLHFDDVFTGVTPEGPLSPAHQTFWGTITIQPRS